jgi:Cytochrome P460
MKISGPGLLLAIASLIALAETGMAAAEGPNAIDAVDASVSSLALAEIHVAAADSPQTVAVADARGSLRVPDDYRMTYQFLGSWAVAADPGKGSQQIHTVYASPGAISAYLKDGHFPDGAVLVKEVFEAATTDMTTGTVSHEQTLKGWFVMVRDTKNSHPENKLWGDGWGWSWFDVGDRAKTTSTDFTSDCQSCHIPARTTDWIYVQGYPVLKR